MIWDIGVLCLRSSVVWSILDICLENGLANQRRWPHFRPPVGRPGFIGRANLNQSIVYPFFNGATIGPLGERRRFLTSNWARGCDALLTAARNRARIDDGWRLAHGKPSRARNLCRDRAAYSFRLEAAEDRQLVYNDTTGTQNR